MEIYFKEKRKLNFLNVAKVLSVYVIAPFIISFIAIMIYIVQMLYVGIVSGDNLQISLNTPTCYSILKMSVIVGVIIATLYTIYTWKDIKNNMWNIVKE